MGNCWKKFYYSLPRQERCPYCKKNQFLDEKETAFKVSTQGCKICRIKMKYFHDSRDNYTRTPARKTSYSRIYDTDPCRFIRNTKAEGRYY